MEIFNSVLEVEKAIEKLEIKTKINKQKTVFSRWLSNC